MPNLNPFRWLRASSQETEKVLQATGELVEFDIEAAGTDSQPNEPKKFNMVAYTGDAIRQWWMEYPVVVDLAGLAVEKKSRPILRDHSTAKIVGHSTKISNDGKQLVIDGVVSSATEHGREVRDLAKDKFPWQASIGATILKLELIAEGVSVKVNGRSFTGPLYVARKSSLKETSFVALGADDDTSATVAAQQLSEGKDSMGFDAWLKAQGFEKETLSPAQLNSLQAMYQTHLNASQMPTGGGAVGAGAGTPFDIEASMSAYRERVAAEEERHGKIRATAVGHPEILANAIRHNWTLEKVELEVIKAERPSSPPIHGGGGKLPNSISAASLEFALCCAANLPTDIAAKGISQDDCNKGTEKELQGLSLLGMYDYVLAAAGEHYRGSRGTEGFIKAAYLASQKLQAAGYSTISLPGILNNVANKALLAGYRSPMALFPKLCKVYSNNDFKPHDRYRLTVSGGLQPLGPDGQPKSAGLMESGYTGQVDTEAVTLTLTRKMQINDSLGAFISALTGLGRMSKIRKEEMFFMLVMSNLNNFFSAGNKNYIEGAGTVLSIDGLTQLVQLFADQVDENAKPILTPAKYLVVPTNLQGVADDLYKSANIQVTTTADKPAVTVNRHAGRYEVLASPYLNNTAIKDSKGKALSGTSSTAHYLWADPEDIPAVGMSVLNGRTEPIMSQGTMDFDILGINWLLIDDFGFDLQDKRGAVKSKGAA